MERVYVSQSYTEIRIGPTCQDESTLRPGRKQWFDCHIEVDSLSENRWVTDIVSSANAV